MLGEKDNAEKLASYAEAAIGRLDAVIAGIPANERPRVYYGRGPNGLETGLASSINMEVLAAVGATNVAETAGSGGLANVSLEDWNPDVILTLDNTFQRAFWRIRRGPGLLPSGTTKSIVRRQTRSDGSTRRPESTG
ncbi:hypothetical protein [Mesorhizobium sp. M0019]|uniref:hypothetical protein n=1 Tax=Mesorhizobium sp. M0019 TaxID=2956845 RepID=UPI0033394A6B